MDVTNWERVLLGTVINDQTAYYEVNDLSTQDFGSEMHSKIWQITSDLAEKEALSQRSLIEGLRDINQLGSVGIEDAQGEVYISYLSTLGDITSFGEASRLVSEASDKRRLEAIAVRLAVDARNGKSSEEIMDDHLSDLLKVRRSRRREPHLINYQKDDLKEETRAKRAGEIMPVWEFPIDAVSDMIPGLLDVDFVLLVAPTGSGKSSFMRNIAWTTAKNGKRILTFTYENTDDERKTWAVAQETGINHKHVIFPQLATKAEYETIQEAWEYLDNVPWKVIEMHGDPINTIRGIVRTEIMKGEVDLIQIDGAYLMGGKGDSAYDLISSNMQGLRSLAQELHIPIMASTQFNRGVRNKTEPEADDILYAGDKPARVILSLIQQEMTPAQAKAFPENWENGKPKLGKNLTAVVVNGHVIKQTNGEIGKTADMKWNKSCQRFETLVDDWKPQVPASAEAEDLDGLRRLEERRQAVDTLKKMPGINTGMDREHTPAEKPVSTKKKKRR